VPKSHPLPSGEGRGEGERSTSNTPPTPPVGARRPSAAPPAEPAPVKVDQTASTSTANPGKSGRRRTRKSGTSSRGRSIIADASRLHLPNLSSQAWTLSLLPGLARPNRSRRQRRPIFLTRTVSINITYLKCDCPCDCDRTGPVNEPKIDPRRYTSTHEKCSAGFQACCIADFPVGEASRSPDARKFQTLRTTNPRRVKWVTLATPLGSAPSPSRISNLRVTDFPVPCQRAISNAGQSMLCGADSEQPERLKQDSPGQRPGLRAAGNQALKGRNKCFQRRRTG